MKVTSAPTFTSPPVFKSLAQAKPEGPVPAQDQVSVTNSAEGQKSKLNYGALAIAGGAVAGGAALGAAAGLRGGIVAELAAWATIPGLAVGGALLGGIAAEKFGPASSEYRAIGGALMGGLAGGVAGIAQGFLAGGAGSPILATTLGVSGALMGAALLFKAASAE